MRLDDVRESENVEDRRGAGGGFGGGGMRGLAFRPTGLGIGGILLLVVVSYFFGIDPMSLLSGDPTGGGGIGGGPTAGAPTGTDAEATFSRKVLKDTEDTWSAIFQRAGRQYPDPTLVLYSGEVDSACGMGSAATGPFYCPGDRKLYLDLSFFQELDRRFGAPGDFAEAYVIAHEVGHHVQNLFGALGSDPRGPQRGEDSQSVRQELQADCLAGVWGHSAATRGLLQPGDAEEGLKAAAAIGDDRLQRQSSGRVMPETFTHGSSAERVAALKRGLDSGDITACGLGR
jgi:hypothetical protein